jgi:hypothetical protein
LPKWKKEDEGRKARGESSLYNNYPTEQARNFLRARFVVDKVTKKLTTNAKTREFMTALDKHNVTAGAASRTSSQGSSMRAKWDTPFNMAMNEVKGQLVENKLSGGRVASYGDVKWTEKYNETPHERKARNKAKGEQDMQGLVEDAIEKALAGLIPAMMQSLSDWIDGGRVGPCPVPSMGGNNSKTWRRNLSLTLRCQS